MLGGDPYAPVQSAPPPVASTQPIAQQSASDDLLGFDLLGGGDDPLGQPSPTSPASAPPFQLSAGVAIDGGSFQTRWGQLQQQQVQQKPMRPGVAAPSTAQVEQVMRGVGINVIASGTMPGGAMKFYFFGKQASGPAPMCVGADVWFLMELLIAPGGTAQATVKAENAQAPSVDGFYGVVWQALDAIVIR